MKKPLIFASILFASFAAGCDDGTGTGGAGGATASSSTGASMTSSSTATTSGSTSTATGSTSTATSSVSTGSAMSMFQLTSPAFMEGDTLSTKYTCASDPNQVSPPLAWAGAPAGTMSFAIVFTDKNNNLRHSAIYDIPPSVISLPEDVEKVFQPSVPAGAKQAKAYTGQFGYAGPCPGSTHTYEFKIYALDVAALPGLGMNSDGQDVETAALAHDLESATLTVQGDPP